MSSTAEMTARREMAAVKNPDKVSVKVKVSWKGGICLPDEKGTREEEAVFSVLTFGDNWALEKGAGKEVDVGDGRTKMQVADLNEYRRLMIRRNLLSWSLPIPVEKDAQGWMTQASYERVSKIPAPLMEAFVRGLEKSVEITDEEEQRISRQCAVLFSKTAHGVHDACEAVSLFCSLGNFWEKFGLDKEKLPVLPYKEYLMLKIVMGKEAEAARIAARPRPQSNTRVAGPGGRIRPSRAVPG